MPLQRQQLPVKLVGLNTKVDPKGAPVGVLTLVENMYQQQQGLWRKRNGVSRKVNQDLSGTQFASAYGISRFGSAACALNVNSTTGSAPSGGLGDYAVVPWSTQGSGWLFPNQVSARGRAVQASVSPVSTAPGLGGVTANAAFGDMAGANGVELYASQETTTTTRVSVILRDAATGAIRATSVINNAVQPQVRSDGTRWIYLFYIDTSGSALKVALYDTQSATLSSSTSSLAAVHATAATGYCFDAVWVSSQSKLAVAYYGNNASPLGVFYYSQSTGLTNFSNNAGDPTLCLGWLQNPGSSSVYLATSGSTNGVQVLTFAATTLALSSTATVDAVTKTARNITGFDTGSNGREVYYEVGATPLYNTSIMAAYQTSGAWVADNTMHGLGLASRPFLVDGAWHFMAVYRSTLQSQYILICYGSQRGIGQIYYGRTPATQAPPCVLSGAYRYTSTSVRLPVVRIARTIWNGTNYSTFGVVDALTLTMTGPQTIEAAGSLWLSGMSGRVFDGTAEAALPFFGAPEDPTLVGTSILGGSLTASATYRYQTVWARIDATGRIWRSPPSNAVNITIAGAGQNAVQLTQPTYRSEGYAPGASSMFLEVYRANGAASTDFRLVSADGVSSTQTFNIPGSDTVTFSDLMSDANQQKREPIYTTGNVLFNNPPPPCSALALHQNRVWLVSAEDPLELWPSKQLRQGFGVGWHPSLNVRIDDTTDPVTGLMSMDTTLVAFKAHGIWAITGDGPNDLGQGEWGLPQRISVDVGAIDARAMALTPAGIIFKSDKGFYLLTRSMQVEYIGAPVETWNSLTVNGATIVQGVDHVRFTTNEGRTLVYDWTLQQWYTWTNQASVGSCLLNGVWSYMDSSGFAYVETPGAYSDNGSAIVSRVTIAPISAAALGGFQRIYELALVGGYVGDHTMNVAVTYDFAAASAQPLTAAVTSTTGLPLLRGRVAQQKCSAFGLDISDSLVAGSGGFTLSGLMLTVGVKEGVAFGGSTQLA